MYGSIAGWQQYVEDYGVKDLVVDSSKASVLVRASDYIKYHYVVNFLPGNENVPEIELATYAVACVEAKEPGFFSGSFVSGQEKVLMQLDNMRWEKVKGSNSDALDNAPMVPVLTNVEMMMRRYMRRKNTVGVFSVGPK